MKLDISRISTIAGIIIALALVATSNGLPQAFAVHTYSTSISPSVAQVNTGSTFTVTINNAAQGELPRRVGAFTVAIPASFTNLGAPSISPPPGRTWTCSVSGSTLSCNAINPEDRLFDGESLTVSISAIPTLTGTFQWTVTAYHFRNYSSPITLVGPQPSVTVTGLGSIKVVKDTDPEPDPTNFNFTSTTLSPNSFQLDDDGFANNPLSNNKNFNNIPAGIYDVAEGPAAGYITTASCSDGSPVNAINLGPGESITCTFKNSQPGTITIVKDAIPDDPTDFAFTTTGSGLSNFSLDDDGDNGNGLSNEQTFQLLSSGTYTVTENVPPGWAVTDIDCQTSGGTTFGVSGNTVTINLAGSGMAVCTFMDAKLGSITVVKDTIPNDATAFSFTSTTLIPNNFQLDDDGDNGNALSNTVAYNNLIPGTYDLTEAANPSYQTLAECSDGSPVNAIALDSGENITCTFTNLRVGTITIIKDAQPDNAQDFTFTALFIDAESFVLDDDGDNGNELSNQISFTLAPNTYSVSELATFGWVVSSIDCQTTGGTTFIPAADTVTITLTPDGSAVCTFANAPGGSSGGSNGGLFRGRSFAFGIDGSANFDEQPPTIGNVLIQSGSLKVVAEIRDNVGVKDAKLYVGAAAYPMTRYEGNAFYWVGIVPNEDLAGNRVSFVIVARDYNNNIEQYADSAEVEEPVGTSGPRASFAVKPLTSSTDQPAAYAISASGVNPGDTDQNASPQITITNTSTETLENIRLILSPELKGKFLLSDYAIKTIAPNSEFTVSMKLNGKPNVDEMGNPIPYYGQVIIVVDNGTPNVLELSGDIPNESSMLHSIFMKNIASKGEQRYKSFEKPEQRISGAEYAVRLGSGETVVRSASEELIISNTSDKPLKNLRIMTSSIGDHFLPDTKNIAVLPAGSFIKVKLVSKMNNAETRGLSGEIIIAPENGVPVTVPVEIGETLREDKNVLYEVSTISGNGAISNTADGIVIKNNSEESIDNVRVILPQQLARVFSVSEDSFKSIEPDSERTISLQQRGTVDSSAKQILNDYSGDIIIVSSDGMKKTVPVRIAWKGISSEHFVINARDNAEELTKATQVINFLERSYAETAMIVGETNTKMVIYMTSSLDEVKLLSDALAPSTYVFNEDVALIWSDSEDVNTLALKEFTYRTIMNNYGTYWAKQKVSLDKGNWLVDGIANYVTSGIVGERGIIKEQLEAFVAEPTSFQWYGASTLAEHGASYSLFKFLVREYGDGIIDRTLKNLGSTMVSNSKCESIEQCALLRAVYDANGMNINDKRHDLNFAGIVEEWKTYVQNEYSISDILE